MITLHLWQQAALDRIYGEEMPRFILVSVPRAWGATTLAAAIAVHESRFRRLSYVHTRVGDFYSYLTKFYPDASIKQMHGGTAAFCREGCDPIHFGALMADHQFALRPECLIIDNANDIDPSAMIRIIERFPEAKVVLLGRYYPKPGLYARYGDLWFKTAWEEAADRPDWITIYADMPQEKNEHE